MLYWIRYPFIRITASFAAGILFNYYTNVSLKLSVILLVASIFSLWVTRRYWKKNRFHQFNLIISFLAFSNIFLLGSLCLHCRNPALNKHHILRIPDEFDHYVLRVTDVPDTSGSWAKFPGEIQLIHHTAKWHKAGGKLLVYIPESVTVHFGDRLLIQGMPQRIKPPLNPDEFDYQLFMQHKGIFFHHFIQPGSFVNLESKHRFSFYGISLKARNGIAQILTERFSDTPTRGIMLALLTGQRQYIDPETYGRFIQIGVVHTLAVSGLHVGIIYMFLVMLFKPFHRHTWSKKICLGLKIIVLLFFAFLTGLSPSVLRATLMFSAMILGKILNRNSHVLNSVFLSAFLLLCIDPYLLYDLGFQLS
jgi:competence protein ComEC